MQAADRLAQNNSMHLLYGILVLLFVLIAFQTSRKWLEVGGWECVGLAVALQWGEVSG